MMPSTAATASAVSTVETNMRRRTFAMTRAAPASGGVACDVPCGTAAGSAADTGSAAGGSTASTDAGSTRGAEALSGAASGGDALAPSHAAKSGGTAFAASLPAGSGGKAAGFASGGRGAFPSRSRLKALILAGEIAIDGRTIRDPAHRVNAGAAITVRAPPPADPAPGPEAITLAVVYEDAELIVIDKPAGLVVHPAAGNWTGTLVNALIAHCGDSLSGIGGVKRPGIVHRLDKDTSGLLVVAKTDAAHRALAAQFADHGRTGPLERGYLAFVWGAPDRPKGRIEAPIARHPHARDKMAVREGGRHAVTRWEVAER